MSRLENLTAISTAFGGNELRQGRAGRSLPIPAWAAVFVSKPHAKVAEAERKDVPDNGQLKLMTRARLRASARN